MSDYSQLLSENKALKEEVERLKLLVPKVSPTPALTDTEVVKVMKPYVAKSVPGPLRGVKGR